MRNERSAAAGLLAALRISARVPQEPARPRDYYRIEDEDGHRYWVFRDGLYQDSALGAPSWLRLGLEQQSRDIAQGVPGTPLENVSLRISSSPAQPYSFWLERSGVRQYIAWDESLPTEAGPTAQYEEGRAQVRGLALWMRSFFQEKDRYPERIRELEGFQPMSCGDGHRALGPDETWVGGCRFLYRIDTVNPKRFVVTARGVSGFVRGVTIRIDQTGTLTETSDYASSRHAPSP